MRSARDFYVRGKLLSIEQIGLTEATFSEKYRPPGALMNIYAELPRPGGRAPFTRPLKRWLLVVGSDVR